MPTAHHLFFLALLVALAGLAPFVWCLVRASVPRITVLIVRPRRSLRRVSGYAGEESTP